MWERDRLKRIAVISNEESAWTNFRQVKNVVNKIKLSKTESLSLQTLHAAHVE